LRIPARLMKKETAQTHASKPEELTVARSYSAVAFEYVYSVTIHLLPVHALLLHLIRIGMKCAADEHVRSRERRHAPSSRDLAKL